MVEWNKRWSPFPYCPVSGQCPWKKTLIEKKNDKKKLSKRLWLLSNFAISLNFLSKNIALSCFIKLRVRYSIQGKYVEFVLNKLKLQTSRKISMFRFNNFYIKWTIIVCSGITFSKNSYHVESSQLNCNAIHWLVPIG